MKTRTFVSLVFGLGLLAPLSLFSSGLPAAPGLTNAPVQVPPPPETAAVTVLSAVKPLPDTIKLTGWLAELVKMAESGIGQDVLLSYIDGAGTFNLGADHIIYLHDIGVSSEVITAMIQHDADVAAGVRQVTAAAPPGRLEFSLPPLPPTPPTVANLYAELPNDSQTEVPDEWNVAGPFDLFDDWAPVDEKPEISPVRKPYAVQLTAPIVVYRAQGRIPNLTLLHSLP